MFSRFVATLSDHWFVLTRCMPGQTHRSTHGRTTWKHNASDTPSGGQRHKNWFSKNSVSKLEFADRQQYLLPTNWSAHPWNYSWGLAADVDQSIVRPIAVRHDLTHFVDCRQKESLTETPRIVAVELYRATHRDEKSRLAAGRRLCITKIPLAIRVVWFKSVRKSTVFLSNELNHTYFRVFQFILCCNTSLYSQGNETLIKCCLLTFCSATV